MNIIKQVFSVFEVNTYIVYDSTGECVIIDPACNTKQEQKILIDFIEKNRLKPVKLLNTHCHLDHVFGNKFISETFSLKTEAHKEEEFNINNAVHAAEIYGVKMDKPNPIQNYINEPDKIKFGNSELDILHVPGHTAGSLVFYNENEHFAVCGDVIFKGSIGRTDLPGGNYETLINQISLKLFPLNNNTILYPGHGSETTIGNEKKYNPFLNGTYV
jgi:glyoxylase-like metal-dependent hydrolase (beta-lactamase superfamily II)